MTTIDFEIQALYSDESWKRHPDFKQTYFTEKEAIEAFINARLSEFNEL